MTEFKINRLGILLKPEPGNANEIEGVLNPAAVRGPDKKLYLFPRIIAKGNYSRIGISRVIFDDKGDPSGVERLGIALEPEAPYELRGDGRGGCEDPRITYVEELKHYIMTYTALSPEGPRIALARSKDLFHWERLGLAEFSVYHGKHHTVDFDQVDNKDACIFPETVPDANGNRKTAILHRPLFPGTRPEETINEQARKVDTHRESIWISFCDCDTKLKSPEGHFNEFSAHERLAVPEARWERLKIGCGTPPVLTPHGWMVIYHGVSPFEDQKNKYCYSAGVMILSKDNPLEIVYRSAEPILMPELPEEREGVVSNVVFPTGIDRRDDLGTPNRFDIYYGMADSMIGVARLDIPEILPRMEKSQESKQNQKWQK